MNEYKDYDLDLVSVDTKKLIKDNYFDNAVVKLSNMIARGTTIWTLKQQKLFLMALSKIDTINNNNEVILPIKDIADKLGVDSKNRSKLEVDFDNLVNDGFKELMTNTNLSLYSKNSKKKWIHAQLITTIIRDEDKIKICFNQYFMPILAEVKKNYTFLEIDNIVLFRHKATYNLYIYLKSWFDYQKSDRVQKIAKKEIAHIFGLEEDEYWRNYGTDKAKFNWGGFEKRCLNIAKDEINELNKKGLCDLCIIEIQKIKEGANVLGYDIYYTLTDKDGYRMYPKMIGE